MKEALKKYWLEHGDSEVLIEILSNIRTIKTVALIVVIGAVLLFMATCGMSFSSAFMTGFMEGVQG